MLGALYSLCPKDRALTNLPNTIQSDDDKVYGGSLPKAEKKIHRKDIAEMKNCRIKAADRNPYSWNMDFYEYSDGSGYEDDLQSAEFAC